MTRTRCTCEARCEQIDAIITAIGYKPTFHFDGWTDITEHFRKVADDPPSYEVDEVHRIKLQLKVDRPDTFTGADAVGYGAVIDATDLSDSQLVRAVFGAILAFEEHETREAFTFRGRRVFGPHLDVEALWSVAEQYGTEVPIDAELVEA